MVVCRLLVTFLSLSLLVFHSFRKSFFSRFYYSKLESSENFNFQPTKGGLRDNIQDRYLPILTCDGGQSDQVMPFIPLRVVFKYI